MGSSRGVSCASGTTELRVLLVHLDLSRVRSIANTTIDPSQDLSRQNRVNV